jgi:hypothetical protein
VANTLTDPLTAWDRLSSGLVEGRRSSCQKRLASPKALRSVPAIPLIFLESLSSFVSQSSNVLSQSSNVPPTLDQPAKE